MDRYDQGGAEQDSLHLSAETDSVEIEVSGVRTLGNIIKVVALGGAGGNAGNYVHKKHLPFVEVAAYNTDQQDLEKLAVEKKYIIGPKVTAMMGAGRDPQLGEEAMRESADLLYSFLQEDADENANRSRFAFVLGGLGGGTASGAVPVAAEVCKELGYITLAVLTIPPRHHGEEAMRIALAALERVEQIVDKVLLIDNERIYSRLPQEKKAKAFEIIDAKVADAIESFVNIISRVPRENVDPNDIRTTLTSSATKLAVIGTGSANREAEATWREEDKGNARVSVALDNAINSPILLYNSIVNARIFLLHVVTHPEDGLLASEERALATRLAGRAGLKAWPSILSGGGEDAGIEKGSVQVTLIATGFEELMPSGFVKTLLQAEQEQQTSQPQALMPGVHTEDDQFIMSLLNRQSGVAEGSAESTQPPVAQPEAAPVQQPLFILPNQELDETTVQGAGSPRAKKAAKTQAPAEVRRGELDSQLSLFDTPEEQPVSPQPPREETALARRKRRSQEAKSERNEQ